MAKKILSAILAASCLMSVGVVMTGCGNKAGSDSKPVVAADPATQAQIDQAAQMRQRAAQVGGGHGTP